MRSQRIEHASLGMLELVHGILEAGKGQRNRKEAQEMLRKNSLVFGLTLGSDTQEERVIKSWNAKKG